MAIRGSCVEKVDTKEAGVGNVGNKRGLCWKIWHQERLVLKKVALRQAFVGKGGTRRGLWWKCGTRRV